jgi:hypothetical protein
MLFACLLLKFSSYNLLKRDVIQTLVSLSIEIAEVEECNMLLLYKIHPLPFCLCF